MWTAIGLGLLKSVPKIISLVEGAVSKDDVDRAGDGQTSTSNKKLDLALGITTLMLNQSLPAGVGLTTRQREAIIGAINANVELANAFKEEDGEGV